MAARRPKNVSAWLGGNRGTVQSGSSTEQQVDTGGGEKDAVNSTLALGIAGAVGLTAAGVALGKSGVPARVVKKVNPFYGVFKNSGSDLKQGQATAEQLMKFRSIDRYTYPDFKTPPKIVEDTEHLLKIRKQNLSADAYENNVRLYSDDDLSKYKNLYEDIKDRGIQSPVIIGRVNGKKTLMEGNHRVIAQFDINPKTKIPFAYNKLNDIKKIKKK